MGGPGRNKDTGRRTAVAHLKATQALELRVRGASVRGISEALAGCGKSRMVTSFSVLA
jgi:hypothetical protein